MALFSTVNARRQQETAGHEFRPRNVSRPDHSRGAVHAAPAGWPPGGVRQAPLSTSSLSDLDLCELRYPYSDRLLQQNRSEFCSKREDFAGTISKQMRFCQEQAVVDRSRHATAGKSDSLLAEPLTAGCTAQTCSFFVGRDRCPARISIAVRQDEENHEPIP